jgi:hypothetical protein
MLLALSDERDGINSCHILVANPEAKTLPRIGSTACEYNTGMILSKLSMFAGSGHPIATCEV